MSNSFSMKKETITPVGDFYVIRFPCDEKYMVENLRKLIHEFTLRFYCGYSEYTATNIQRAVSHKLWDYRVANPCQTILEAAGDQALAICLAGVDGWWDDGVKEYTRAILESNGSVADCIFRSKKRGRWDDSVKNATLAIIECDDNAEAMINMRVNGLWDNDVKDISLALFESNGKSYSDGIKSGITHGYITRTKFIKYSFMKFVKTHINTVQEYLSILG